jgi:hypothetical protein
MLYEERNISRATATLEELRRVRDLFRLPGAGGEEEAGPDEQSTQQQQVYKPFNVEQAQIFDTPLAEVFVMSRCSEGSGEER